MVASPYILLSLPCSNSPFPFDFSPKTRIKIFLFYQILISPARTLDSNQFPTRFEFISLKSNKGRRFREKPQILQPSSPCVLRKVCGVPDFARHCILTVSPSSSAVGAIADWFRSDSEMSEVSSGLFETVRVGSRSVRNRLSWFEVCSEPFELVRGLSECFRTCSRLFEVIRSDSGWFGSLHVSLEQSAATPCIAPPLLHRSCSPWCRCLIYTLLSAAELSSAEKSTRQLRSGRKYL